jgi:LEA14-like dessication related protein
MPKQCPLCFQVYSDHAQFCNNDGTPLSPPNEVPSPPVKSASGRQRRLLKIIVPLTLAALAAAVGAGYLVYQRHLQSRIAVVIEEIKMPDAGQSPQDRERTGALGRIARGILDAARVAAGSGDLMAQVKIENKASFPGAITSANYVILTGDKELGKGAWAPAGGSYRFSPRQEIFLDLPFRLEARNMAAGVLDALAGRGSPVLMRGEMKIKIFVMTFKVPFEARLIRPQPDAPERVYRN